MPELAFGQYKPDISDLNSQFTRSLNNVLPRGDGYGPLKSLVEFTDALTATCRGFFHALNSDGSTTIFAATSKRIYKLDNTDFSWDDVSKGSPSDYSELSTSAQWVFVQFNNFVIAVQANVAPQVFDLTSSTQFADLAGSPPQAAYASVVGRFIVLSGLQNQPYRIQWSGLNDTTGWTSGENFSDFQDLPDGGPVRGVAGGEYGLIMQDQSIRRMIYAPGSEFVFQIDRIAEDRGLLAPYSLIPAGDRIFFYSAQGFIQSDASGQLNFIGKEKVDRTFFADYDASSPQLMIGVADPSNNVVVWVYKSIDSGAQENLFNKLLIYDWSLQEWAAAEITGEYIYSLAKPGLTLEALDSISSSIDSFPFSLDAISTTTLPALSLASPSHMLGFLSGDNLEATLETAEYNQDGFRTEVNGVIPITDSADAVISIATRDTLSATPTYGDESELNEDGYAPLLEEGRYVRAKVRIPLASTWTYARGIMPDFMLGSPL